MTQPNLPKINPNLDLVLERIVDVSPELVWKAWTEPEHLLKWFTPAPWSTVACEIDLRPGGIFATTMRSPEGQEFPCPGCYLEVIENRKLVFTGVLGPDFRPIPPSEEGLAFTGFIILEPHGEGTKYTAIAMHGDEATRQQHSDMGFETGWSMALDQLVAYVKSL